MTKNDGTAYEALTEEVFRRVLGQELCVDVQRDVKLQGRSTRHQIDVFFRFRAGDIEYQTIVQCKDWGSAVKQEQVLAFNAVLQDIPGQPRGIIVARSGFQSGARQVAEHHGIQLYELRPPRDEDWDGLVREIRLTMHVTAPQWQVTDLDIDKEWFAGEAARLGEPPGEKYRFTGVPHRWFTPDGTLITDAEFARMVSGSLPEQAQEWTPFAHEFDAPLDVEGMTVDGLDLPRIRVRAIEGRVRVHEHTSEMVISADHLVAYCFRDVLGGKVAFLNESGGRIEREGP